MFKVPSQNRPWEDPEFIIHYDKIGAFVTRTSLISGKVHSKYIEGLTEKMMKKFENGTLIQVALKGLTFEEREFILTGITPEEWVENFE